MESHSEALKKKEQKQHILSTPNSYLYETPLYNVRGRKEKVNTSAVVL